MKTNKKHNLIQEILALSLEINDDKTNSITIFVSFSGHCDGLQVRVYLNGWNKENQPDQDFHIFMDYGNCNKNLSAIRNYLLKLKNKQIKIPA